jgi:signal transduction histidine kinase/CheY-like chemotaxis protein/HPt (histidine-containing phosphotransfer) domain-containing protein
MMDKETSKEPDRKAKYIAIDKKILWGFLLALVTLAIIGFFSYQSIVAVIGPSNRAVYIIVAEGGFAFLLVLLAAFFANRDMLKLIISETKVNNLNRELIEAVEMKTQFLANISHEMRTPLNSVIGMSGEIIKTQLNAEQKEYASCIQNSAENLLYIINDILDFSYIKSGKLGLELVDFNLGLLMDDVANGFKHTASQRGIELSHLISPQIELSVRGDPSRVRQILVNLISNAIKFTTKGGVHINITRESTASSQQLRFEVRDTGGGIPKEAFDRMFDAFSQVDNSPSRRFGGVGLGLSISKQLVKLMGGEINLLSEPGVGSTFWFTLPLAKGKTVEKIYVRETLQHNPQLKNSRILVVDDNPMNKMVALVMLKNMGYTAHAVASGNEALDSLREIHHDLILMDCHMPDMDGYQATEIIRKSTSINRRDIPIIAMTADVTKGVRERCLGGGMNDYISKPVDANDLKDKLEKWLLAVDPKANPAIDMKVFEQLKSFQEGNETDVVGDLVQIFLTSTPPRLEKIQKAIVDGNPEQLALEAHTQKSSTAYIGAFGMRDLCLQLEELGFSKSTKGATEIYKKLEIEYGRVCQDLASFAEKTVG